MCLTVIRSPDGKSAVKAHSTLPQQISLVLDGTLADARGRRVRGADSPDAAEEEELEDLLRQAGLGFKGGRRRDEPDASTGRRGQRAARLQIREHVFPRTRGLCIFIERLQLFPDDALDVRRHGHVIVAGVGRRGVGAARLNGLCHAVRKLTSG